MRRKKGVCQEDTGVKGVPFNFFSEISKPPASVYCANFLDKRGTLSFLVGICTMPFLDSIKFYA